jgi:hypothetical protein
MSRLLNKFTLNDDKRKSSDTYTDSNQLNIHNSKKLHIYGIENLRFCLTKMDRRFNEFYIKLKTSLILCIFTSKTNVYN